MSELLNFFKDNIVTIIGLVLTYLGLKKNLTDGFKLQKTENQLNKINNLCMKIKECTKEIFSDVESFGNILDEINRDIVCYGSEKSLAIFVFLREYCTKNDSENNGDIFIFLNLLLAQIRLDTIGEVVNPELLMKMTLQLGEEYEGKRDKIKELNNATVKQLKLDKRFIIK